MAAIDLLSIRVNQRQVNREERQISTCQPDLQYHFLGRTHHMLEEFFRLGMASFNFMKGMVMLRGAEAAGEGAAYLGWQIGRARR
ncbi:MAG: hypothetical protein HUJ27_07180 [Rhodobacteraceae bacterium]|nr:hypothetical protein [Paracoccaceae bacterium]